MWKYFFLQIIVGGAFDDGPKVLKWTEAKKAKDKKRKLEIKNSAERHSKFYSARFVERFTTDSSVKKKVTSEQRDISFFKWANPGLFLVYFSLFQTNNTIFNNK